MNAPDIHELNRQLAESDPIDTTILEKEPDMKLNQLYPSTLLKSQDVTDAGGEMPLKIKSVEMREFDGENGKEQKPILSFEDGHQMVLNKTNGNVLGEMLGDETDDWTGKEITLVVEQVDFAGKRVPAIRIKQENTQDQLVQAFWKKARETGIDRPEGLKMLKEFGNDFGKALRALDAPF